MRIVSIFPLPCVEYKYLRYGSFNKEAKAQAFKDITLEKLKIKTESIVDYKHPPSTYRNRYNEKYWLSFERKALKLLTK